MSNCPTPHNAARKEEIAATVLMPGDPKRSRFIAETYLEAPRLVNDIRGVQGYTGTYHGKPVTVMGHGIGIPSLCVYAYELYKFYDVKRIVRVGSAGSIREDLDMGDMLIAETAFAESNLNELIPLGKDYVPKAVPHMLEAAKGAADRLGFSYRVGTVLSQTLYYSFMDDVIGHWQEKGVDAFEMEVAGLYALADALGKEAIGILTISNNILHGSEMDPAIRERGLTHMIETALELIV